MGEIKFAQKDLYNHIREAPTYEEARSNIGALAQKFLSDVNSTIQEIQQQQKETIEKRKALEAPSATPDQ